MPEALVNCDLVTFWTDEMYALVRYHAGVLCGKKAGEYDDLYQEACLSVAEKQAGQGVGAAPRNYLVRMIRNRMLSLNKRHWRKDVKPRSAHHLTDEVEGGVRRPAEDHPAIFDVLDAVEKLSDSHRRTLWTIYREFRSIAELAEMEGVEYAGADARVRRAYAKLREFLRDSYGPDEWRPRAAPSKHAYSRTGKNVDWSRWGPIPGQRDDDDHASTLRLNPREEP